MRPFESFAPAPDIRSCSASEDDEEEGESHDFIRIRLFELNECFSLLCISVEQGGEPSLEKIALEVC